MGARNRGEEGYRTGPPGHIGWRNSFLGIDSGAPYTFKNTSSGANSHNDQLEACLRELTTQEQIGTYHEHFHTEPSGERFQT